MSEGLSHLVKVEGLLLNIGHLGKLDFSRRFLEFVLVRSFQQI